jgi:predicted nuclease of predicted toxin-antitoxin system
VRFLVDAQLPPALARRIAAAGHVCEHVADCGLLTAADPAIRAYATDVDAIIITKDEDFAVHLLLHGGPSIVWLRVGNTRRLPLLERIDADLDRIVGALESGERLVEVA